MTLTKSALISSGKILVFTTLLFCLLPGCSTYREFRIDRLMQPYAGDQPGAAVMVIRNGEKLFQKGYGLSDMIQNTQVTAETNFRLASVSKQFTAMCIMILEERGKLSYDQKLREIFPEFPRYGENITIRHLLQHTSGLIDYESLIPETATEQVLDADVLDMLMAVDSTYFEPGTEYRYSNSGYAVLAMIVEKISGMRFSKFLEMEIFAPLRMDGSVAYELGWSIVEFRAMGYKVEESIITDADQSITSAVLGDGGIYSSLHDLYLWDQSLYTDTLVSKETLELAFTPLVLPDGRKEIYGFGWRIDEYKGHRRIHHIGSTSGFRTALLRYPDDRLTVVILTNRAEPDPFPLALKISDMYL